MPNEPISTLLEEEDEHALPQGNVTPKPEATEPPENPEEGKPAKRDTPEWQEAFKELAGEVKKIVPKPEPKQLTQDEINEKWGVFDPKKADKDFFKNLFNLPDDVDPKVVERIEKTWALMQAGLMKQAIKGSMNVFEHQYGGKLSKIDELEEWRSQASAKELRADFNREYPALADAKYNKILKLVSAELADREFDDHAAYFKALAEGAAKEIKDLDPSFELGAKTKPTAAATPRLPRTRVGGQGGAGSGGRPEEKDSDQSHTLEL